jgi:peroxiredoxin (alkyl hydroperoxide reductase subunit C)
MASNVIRAVIGKTAPQFKSMAWNCKADKFEELSLDSFKSKWVLLFFYPLDFTFVCPTEIVDFSKKAQ